MKEREQRRWKCSWIKYGVEYDDVIIVVIWECMEHNFVFICKFFSAIYIYAKKKKKNMPADISLQYFPPQCRKCENFCAYTMENLSNNNNDITHVKFFLPRNLTRILIKKSYKVMLQYWHMLPCVWKMNFKILHLLLLKDGGYEYKLLMSYVPCNVMERENEWN